MSCIVCDGFGCEFCPKIRKRSMEHSGENLLEAAVNLAAYLVRETSIYSPRLAAITVHRYAFRDVPVEAIQYGVTARVPTA